MNNENQTRDELPHSARQAFKEYPRITASPEFNRRVLERVLAAREPSRLELFCGRLDEIFSRPVLKLLGVTCLGGVLALLGTSLLFAASGMSTPATSQTTDAVSQNNSFAALDDESTLLRSLDSQSRLAMMRRLENPLPIDEYLPPRNESLPARRERGKNDVHSDERSSLCPVAPRSLV